MFKITGVIILMMGSIGLGYSVNEAMQKEIMELKDFVYIFEILQSCITYRKEMLPEACCFVGTKSQGNIGRIIGEIGEKSEKHREKSFAEYWIEELQYYFKKSRMKKNDQEYILSFPEYAGFSDETMQLNVMDNYIIQLKRRKEEQEQIFRNRKKVVMSICSALGGALVILLL